MIEKTRRSPNSNFLNDADIVRDAWSHLRRRQFEASRPHIGVVSLLRPDAARELIDEHGHRMRPEVRAVARFLTYMRGSVDFAAARATEFATASRRRIRHALRRVPVGLSPTSGFYALQEYAPKGGPVVLIGFEMFGIIGGVADWCIAATPYWGGADVKDTRAGDAIVRWLRGDLQSPPAGGFIKLVGMGTILNMTIFFTLAHEYAHIFNALSGISAHGCDAEYEGDALGLDLMMDMAGNPLNVAMSRNTAAAAAEIVLQTLSLAEDMGIRRRRASHPPSELRLKRHHEQLRAHYGTDILRYLRPYQACFEAARKAI